ncbi:hypothetical protein SAMN03097699_0373 [Flavobacteriaceae bacterium MAR_2010_188]|nr:hypothetical protein SAMN03097699_0373 [Flavobacteriaceae bacterium MAR_2010_188]
MKPASVVTIKKELKQHTEQELAALVLRLARFKKENKELLTYLLFEEHNEDGYVQSIKDEVDELFTEINTSKYFYMKKSLRKILRLVKKYIRYSNKKETEVELLIYFCEKMKEMNPSIFKNITLKNLYYRQVQLIKTRNSKLHEDLQYDFNLKIEEL